MSISCRAEHKCYIIFQPRLSAKTILTNFPNTIQKRKVNCPEPGLDLIQRQINAATKCL